MNIFHRLQDERTIAIDNAAGNRAYMVVSWLIFFTSIIAAVLPNMKPFLLALLLLFILCIGGAIKAYHNWRTIDVETPVNYKLVFGVFAGLAVLTFVGFLAFAGIAALLFFEAKALGASSTPTPMPMPSFVTVEAVPLVPTVLTATPIPTPTPLLLP